MKKKILIALFSIMSLLLFITACSPNKSSSTTSSTSASTDTLAKIKKKGVLVVGSSNDAPFAYIDTKTKKFTGIDADIIKEIAKRIGIKKVEMKQVSFENLLVELNKGSIDMVTDAMYIKKDRLQKAAFTDIWYKEGDAVVIPKNSNISSLSDLKGKIIGAQKGTTFLEIADKWKKEGIVKDVQVYGKQTELMLAVDTGKIAACVTDGIVADYTLSKNSSLSLKLLSSYKSEATGQIGAAVNFSDKSLLNATNKALNKMKKDGTLKKILAKYGLSDKYMVSVSDGITKNIK